MVRNLLTAGLIAGCMTLGAANGASAHDYYRHPSHAHHGGQVRIQPYPYSSGYGNYGNAGCRTGANNYGSNYYNRSYVPPTYGNYGYSSGYFGGFQSGYNGFSGNVPFGGYGAGGYPRSGSYGGSGFSIWVGR